MDSIKISKGLHTRNTTTTQAGRGACRQGAYMITISIFRELHTHRHHATEQVSQTKKIHTMVFG
ncbi:hypothetical protein B7P43_G17666 [Cryptotermes secundus]|uniref:Uncharacterized protein n=1 Tax=Cryptotermes secundus TaxID=105785 RepID=A0A2J7PCU2_9NEOP|nr:hypothetical protein B7P43_G17666 [Cryptotermes secundus]